LNTALSDLEVEYEDIEKPTRIKVPNHTKNTYEFGYLTEFAYKLKDSDERIIVATTRLETMLGDVAVAVHPDDERYKHLIGKSLEHPFIHDRELKISKLFLNSKVNSWRCRVSRHELWNRSC